MQTWRNQAYYMPTRYLPEFELGRSLLESIPRVRIFSVSASFSLIFLPSFFVFIKLYRLCPRPNRYPIRLELLKAHAFFEGLEVPCQFSFIIRYTYFSSRIQSLFSFQTTTNMTLQETLKMFGSSGDDKVLAILWCKYTFSNIRFLLVSRVTLQSRILFPSRDPSCLAELWNLHQMQDGAGEQSVMFSQKKIYKRCTKILKNQDHTSIC